MAEGLLDGSRIGLCDGEDVELLMEGLVDRLSVSGSRLGASEGKLVEDSGPMVGSSEGLIKVSFAVGFGVLT